MEHLISFGSGEYDGASWGRWLPVEERDTLTTDFKTRESVNCAADWCFGDAGRHYVFVCRSCPEWPTSSHMQCG